MTAAETASAATSAETGRSLRVPPVTKRGLGLWILAYVVLTIATVVVGWMIVDYLAGVRRFDDRLSRDLEQRRARQPGTD